MGECIKSEVDISGRNLTKNVINHDFQIHENDNHINIMTCPMKQTVESGRKCIN